MARHQYAVFAEGTRAHHHLEYKVVADAAPTAVTEALVAVRAAGADHLSTGGVNLVVGLGPSLWRALAPDRVPEPFFDFPGYHNDRADLHAPATQSDIWLWIHGSGPDSVLDVALAATAALAAVAELTMDQPCFTYHDSRDLTGFIDGTANPAPDDAPEVAEIPAGQVGQGGSFAMTVRYEHDLQAFHAQSVEDQEAVFGRHKADSVAIPAETRAPDSHISLAEVADDQGQEMQVYRRSVPFADATVQGLHFVSFGRDLERFDRQLRAMYGVDDPTVVDRILPFTQAHTGSFWLCPSVEDLDAVAPVPEAEDD